MPARTRFHVSFGLILVSLVLFFVFLVSCRCVCRYVSICTLWRVQLGNVLIVCSLGLQSAHISIIPGFLSRACTCHSLRTRACADSHHRSAAFLRLSLCVVFTAVAQGWPYRIPGIYSQRHFGLMSQTLLLLIAKTGRHSCVFVHVQAQVHITNNSDRADGSGICHNRNPLHTLARTI